MEIEPVVRGGGEELGQVKRGIRSDGALAGDDFVVANPGDPGDVRELLRGQVERLEELAFQDFTGCGRFFRVQVVFFLTLKISRGILIIVPNMRKGFLG